MDGLIVWAQPLGVGLASLLMVWIAPRPRRTSVGWEADGSIMKVKAGRPRQLVAAVLLWGVLEAVNGVVPLWRYTLLPGDLPLRLLWLSLFGPSVLLGTWAGGNWLGAAGNRSTGLIARLGPTGLAVFAWLVGVVLLGRASGTGVRVNPVGPTVWPGSEILLPGLVIAVLLFGATLFVRPLSHRLHRIEFSAGRLLGPAALVLTLVVAQGRSVASVVPDLRDLPGALPSQVEVLPVWGVPTVRALAGWTPEALVERVPGISDEAAEALVQAARLSLHEGIGARRGRGLWGLGIRQESDLQEWNSVQLRRELESIGAPRTPTAWIRAWVR